MSDIATIGRPITIEQFIASEGGASNTRTVAQRFGWTISQARIRLRNLERRKVLSSRMVIDPNHRRGSTLEWSLT